MAELIPGVVDDTTPPGVTPDSNVNYSEFQTGQDRVKAADDAAAVSNTDFAIKGLTSGPTGALWDWAERKGQRADPDFSLADHKDLMNGIPGQYHSQFLNVRSYEEGALLAGQIKQELADQRLMANSGTSGFVAYTLGGLLDPVNLALFKGVSNTVREGAIGAAVDKSIIGGGRTANIIKEGITGAGAGAEIALLDGSVKPTGDWEAVPEAALSGFALGGTIGAFSKGLDPEVTATNKSVWKAQNDFRESVAAGETGKTVYDDVHAPADTVFNTEAQVETVVKGFEQQMADLEVKHDAMEPGPAQEAIKAEMDKLAELRIQQIDGGHSGNIRNPGDSVGAASMNSSQAPITDTLTPAQKLMRQEATDFNARNGVGAMADYAFPNNARGTAAKKMYDAIQKTPFASDFDKLFNSNSPIGSALAFKMLESPIGLVRNNKSGAMLNDIYLTNVSREINANYSDAFSKWAAERKLTQPTAIAANDYLTRANFEREFHTEMQSRFHDGQSDSASTQAIRDYADAADRASANAVRIMQGREGEVPVNGSEHLKETSGWWPQRYSGQKLNSVLAELKAKGANGKEVLERTLADQYKALHGWDEAQATKFARAVIRRAIANEEGVDTSAARFLDNEGTAYMQKFLEDSGINAEDAAGMIDHLRNRTLDATKPNFLKARTDMDTRTPIPGTSKTLMDIMDTDVTRVWTGYSRRVAGISAASRHGIQLGDWDSIFAAIKADEAANGGRTLSDDYFSGIKTYFTGGPIAGGVNPWLRRMMQLSHLGLLNNLGLTQMMETGVTIASLGVKTFVSISGKELKAVFKGTADTQAMKELSSWLSPITGEHMLIRDDLMLDQISKDPGTASELGHFLDRTLSKGQRVQGYVTGFYKVKQLQQRIAIRGMMQRLGEMYREGKAISSDRLLDMGLDNPTAARIGKYFTDGTIEYGKDGEVLALNPEQWKPADFEAFTLALNRFTHQMVQKSMKGESSVWMHKETGAILMDLKAFTILSMQKQLLRNARLMDATSAMSFFYGLATAATVIAAKNSLTGHNDRNTVGQVTAQALGGANMTAIVPSITDPMMSMMGLGDYRINNYGNYGQGDIISAPPMFGTLNRMLKAPSAVAKIATGEYKNSDIYAAQSLPIIGNLTGMGIMWNSLKQDPKAKQEPVNDNPVEPTEPATPAVKPEKPAPVPKAHSSAAVKEGTKALKELKPDVANTL